MRWLMVTLLMGLPIVAKAQSEPNTDVGRLRAIYMAAYLSERAAQCGMPRPDATQLFAMAMNKAMTVLSSSRVDEAQVEAVRGERQARIERVNAGAAACASAIQELKKRAGDR